MSVISPPPAISANRARRKLATAGVGVVLSLAHVAVALGQTGPEIRVLDVAPPPAESLPSPLAMPGEPAALTLESLEQQALAGNPSIRRLAALVGAARGNTLQAGLYPNPSVGYEGQQLGSGGLAEQHGVLFTQEFIRGGKLQLSRAVADRERFRLEQELAAQQLRVLTDVRIAFYQVLLAQRQIDVANELVNVNNMASQSVDALYQAKEVGRADILQSQLEAENARILAENARNRYQSTWRNLAAVLGQPELPLQQLAGDPLAPPKEYDFQEALTRLLQMSPEIAVAAAEVDRARLAVERARAEPVPNVVFQGLVNWQDNGIGGKPDGGVAVTVPIPLFNRNQGAICATEKELIAAREASTQLELALQGRLAPVFEQYANAKNQVVRYRKTILPAAQESLDLNRRLYDAGEANFTTLLTVQRTYAQTQFNYLDALRALRIAEVQIEGFLLDGSLQHSVSR